MKLGAFVVAAAFVVACLAPVFCLAQGQGIAEAALAERIDAPNVDQPASDLHPHDKVQTTTLASTQAQPAPKISAPVGPWAGNPTKFFEGAFVGFLGHETGHLIANTAMNTDPYLVPVHYGPVPFFTIEPGRPLNRHEHYITSSAGFNATNLIDEWLLTAHPLLSQEDKPFLKGMASFNFWVNVGYAATAFAGTGPDQRDTKGMADSLGWSEWEIGAMVLVPTGLDTYRYKHPDAKWAATLSRIAKLYMIFLAVNAQD